MPKPGKLQKILENTKLGDDMTIAVGDESFTLGDLRAMDADTEGESTAALEERENNLIKAQAGLAETLQKVSQKTGIPLDNLLAGDFDSVVTKPGEVTLGDDDDPLSELDPKVLKALEKRFGKEAVSGEVTKIKQELADTRKALGIALKVNMDDYYQSSWDRLKSDIPEGVKLDLNSALKYADENNIREKGTGRYNLSKAIRDLTSDARMKAEVERARLEGEKLGREKALMDAMPRPGQNRQSLMKPPVDDKGRTKTLDAVLTDAMNDTDIAKMMSGVVADA